MEFSSETLRIVQEFVPEDYQSTPQSFINYLRTLPNGRKDIRLYSMAIDQNNGIQVLEFFKGKTEVHEMSWGQIKNQLDIEYKKKYPASPQYQLHLEQLNNAF